MSYILVDKSSKGGLCCSRSIDLERGCINRCVGCYGTKTSLMGSDKYFNNIVAKDFNESKFKKSCELASKQGYSYIRLGKHSDAANISDYEILKRVIEISHQEGLKLIFVTKSLKHNKDISKLLRDNDHILHISLGMLTDAPSDIHRLNTFLLYKNDKVNVRLRITSDITEPINSMFTAINKDRIIVTPMRFISKEVADYYNIDLTKYKYVNGYYKPILEYVHESWKRYSNWCGEVYTETGVDVFSYCAKCGVNNEM